MAYYLTSFSKLFSSFSKSGKQLSWHIMATTSKLEQRCVIKFCANANMTPTDTLKFIQRGNQHTDVSRSLVFAWHKKFRDGLDDVFDKPRSGRPCRGEDEVRRVQDIISEDRRRSVREISDLTGICVNVVYRILTDTLKMNKVCARWVPRLLTQDQKTTRVQMSRSFLGRFDRICIENRIAAYMLKCIYFLRLQFV